MYWYWILILCAFAFPIILKFIVLWIVVPIRVHAKQTLAARPNLQFATPDDVTHELREMLQSVLPQFRAEGFESAAMTCSADNVPGVRSVVATLVNRPTQDVAVIISTHGKAARSLVYAIRSEFADDTIVSTGVNPGIGVYPKDPNEHPIGFSRLSDIHALCEFHRRRLRQLGLDQGSRHPIPPGSEIDRVIREWDRTTSRLVRHGYMYLDGPAGLFRYTWKGAFLCTWRLIQPIKRWRIKWRDRKAARVWRDLDMDGYRAPVHAPTAVAPAPFQSPTNTPSIPPPLPPQTDLAYETTLPEGEIREEQSPGQLTVRMGTPTAGRYLARRWGTLLMIGVWCFLIGSNLYLALRIQLAAARVGVPLSFSVMRLSTLAIGIFLIIDVVKLVTGVIALRGTIVITASPQGLTFRNTPAAPHSGHIDRPNLRGLAVLPHQIGLRKKLWRLAATSESDRSQTLLISPDQPRLEHLRTALAKTIGIE